MTDDLTVWCNQLTKNVKDIYSGEENAKSYLRGNILAFCLHLDKYDSDNNESYGFQYPVDSHTKQEIIMKCISKEYPCVGKGAVSSDVCDEGCKYSWICYTDWPDRCSKLDSILKTIKDEVEDYERRVLHSKSIDRHTKEYKERIQSKIEKLNEKLGI